MEKMRTLGVGSMFVALFSIILSFSPRLAQSMEFDTDRPGMSYKIFDLSSPDPNLCERACKEDPQHCKAWTYVKPGILGPKALCSLKSGVPPAVKNTSCISGIVQQVPPAKPSGQQVPPAVPKEGVKQAGPQPKSQDVKLAQDRIKRMAEFDKNWRVQVRQIIGDANQKLAKAQVQRYEKSVQTLRVAKTSAVPHGKVRPKVVEDRMKEIAAIKPAQKVQAGAKMLRTITKVTGLVGGTTWKENDVEEGSYIQIYGKGFGGYSSMFYSKTTGKKGCGVALEYGDAPKEFQKAGPLNHKIDLIPIDGDWNKCWSDTGIIAMAPIFPESTIQIVGNLVVWGKDFILNHPVQFRRAGPGIEYFTTAPEFNDRVNRYGASSGGQISVYGRGFGNQPGKIYLELHDQIGSLKQIFLTARSWTDSNIIAEIPKVPGNYPFQTARLNVLNTQLNRLSYTSIQFGPRMIYTLVSGKDFLELATPAHPGKDMAEEQETTLLITHDPDCGPVIGSGNHGTDYFFRNKILPPNCKLVRGAVSHIDPSAAQLNWLGNEVTHWIAEILSGDWIKKGLSAFAKMFDSSVGNYGIVIQKQPTENSPQTVVFFDTTCSSISQYNGVPLKYIATFMLWGPEGIVPGTPAK